MKNAAVNVSHHTVRILANEFCIEPIHSLWLDTPKGDFCCCFAMAVALTVVESRIGESGHIAEYPEIVALVAGLLGD